jgi:hypothetical protein
MGTSGESIRRWIKSRRAAERWERDVSVENTPSPAESVARALDLITLAASVHGWTLPSDPVNAREDARAYERWVRLRTRLSEA